MVVDIVEAGALTRFQSARFPREAMPRASASVGVRQPTFVKALPVRLLPATTVREAFLVIAANCIEQFSSNRAAFFIGAALESVHLMRVAIRRLRSLLTFHKRLLPQDDYEWLRTRLKRVFAVLGAARSLDVLIDHIADRAIPCTEDDLRRIAAAREAAYRRVEALLGSKRLTASLRRLKLWLSETPLKRSTADKPVRPYAKAVLRRQHRAVRRFDRGPRRLDTEGLHRLRIHAKKLRYACEFFASAFPESGKRGKPLFAALEKLQDALGAFNDLATFSDIQFAGHSIDPAMAPAKEAERLRKASIKALRGVLHAPEFWKSA